MNENGEEARGNHEAYALACASAINAELQR